ncbi:hypothetical protein [Amycolatopsis sp. lyj-112]|uniref:hypothetical protein n=1 Tax=Amycolatopsis sp. lyj-112 TaxID=2789288 RepID=UPI00397BD94F
MALPSGGDASSYPVFVSARRYNSAYPDAAIPDGVDVRNTLRSYTCAGAGLDDDLRLTGAKYTLDFLPGGAPEPDGPDRVGTVIATRWGNTPYVVLAEQVSLRRAWDAITRRWPAELSAAAEALRPLTTSRSSEPSAGSPASPTDSRQDVTGAGPGLR